MASNARKSASQAQALELNATAHIEHAIRLEATAKMFQFDFTTEAEAHFHVRGITGDGLTARTSCPCGQEFDSHRESISPVSEFVFEAARQPDRPGSTAKFAADVHPMFSTTIGRDRPGDAGP